ncbi:hypothetical protein EVAR_10942_1 [Eumeta japonica]|uniref:Uncharacterized protein n=1 Tax=Eumeta variegata TaxID=151549 RepID=A0A4C1U736_EUMVA|nr:hypothetical protein EVAR_10942_1 [Eumeta japonica]
MAAERQRRFYQESIRYEKTCFSLYYVLHVSQPAMLVSATYRCSVLAVTPADEASPTPMPPETGATLLLGAHIS